jgi:hypothetical protein
MIIVDDSNDWTSAAHDALLGLAFARNLTWIW